MPNFKVFQDSADQMRVKIYGSNNQAFNTDASGNLTITTAGLAVTGNIDVGTVTVTSAGLAITGNIDVGTVTVTSTGMAVTGNIDVGTVTVTSTGLAITGNIDVGTVTVTSTGLAVTGNIDVGTVTVTSSGLAVTGNIDVGTVSVTTGSDSLAVCIGTGDTTVKINSVATTDVTETITNKTSTTYSGTTERTILGVNTWTFAVKNDSLETNAQANVQLQLSATALTESDWYNDGSITAVNQNSVVFLTSTYQVKYARVYYAAVNASSAVTLTILLQGLL